MKIVFLPCTSELHQEKIFIVRNNDEKLTRAEFEKVLKVILIILKKRNILIHKLIFRA